MELQLASIQFNDNKIILFKNFFYYTLNAKTEMLVE